MKTFTVAGTSKLNGEIKFRVANDLKQRIAVLERNDHTEIRLIELPEPMSKQDAAKYVLALAEFADVADVVSEAVEGPTAPAKQSKPKAAKAAASPRTGKTDAVADEADVVDDDGFVEPKDEATQVAMTRLAREYPGLSAKQLYEMLKLTVKHFNAPEPNF